MVSEVISIFSDKLLLTEVFCYALDDSGDRYFSKGVLHHAC